MRPILTTTLALAALAAGGLPAAAAPELVVDLGSGRVLLSNEARRAWHPASLTKLMTTYVALRAIAAGRVAADTPVTVSATAAKAPPSRSGLPVGSRITLGDALKVLMVKSANDLAVAIAEAVEGDQAAFVGAMNRESHRLGMTASRWRNPHGLDDPAQVTTAHDLALLAGALYRDFPGMAGLFAIGAVSLRGTVMGNHNGAIGRYAGSDGMKTGFICASGFNVVSTASRDGRRVAVVLLGRDNALGRDARASLLLEAALRTAPGSGTSDLGALAGSDGLPAPRRTCGRRGAQDEDDVVPAATLSAWEQAFARAPRNLGPPVAIAVLPPATLAARAPVPPAAPPAPPPSASLPSVVSAYAPLAGPPLPLAAEPPRARPGRRF